VDRRGSHLQRLKSGWMIKRGPFLPRRGETIEEATRAGAPFPCVGGLVGYGQDEAPDDPAPVSSSRRIRGL